MTQKCQVAVYSAKPVLGVTQKCQVAADSARGVGVVISEQHKPEGGEPLSDAGWVSALCRGARQTRRPCCLEGHLCCRI